jgi:transglutaminase-like putative cysteine protease
MSFTDHSHAALTLIDWKQPMNDELKEYLAPTEIIDSDHETIIDYARNTIGDSGDDPVAKAVKLYYGVRDPIWYNPYLPFFRPEHYRASTILKKGQGFCVPKASLLCALGRASNIPSRVGFATVSGRQMGKSNPGL